MHLRTYRPIPLEPTAEAAVIRRIVALELSGDPVDALHAQALRKHLDVDEVEIEVMKAEADLNQRIGD